MCGPRSSSAPRSRRHGVAKMPPSERAGDERAPTAECIERRRLREERPHDRRVPPAEDDLRHDTRLADRVRQALRAREVVGDRLLEQQRLASPRCLDGEVGLDRGWHGERHHLARVEQVLIAGERLAADATDELGRRLGSPRPHTGQLRLGPGGQHRPVHQTGPRPCSDQADGDSHAATVDRSHESGRRRVLLRSRYNRTRTTNNTSDTSERAKEASR